MDGVGNAYVSEIGNHRVQYFTSTGGYLGGWGGFGNTPGLFYGAEGIAHDAGNNRIQKFTPSGSLLSVFGTLGNALGQLYTPSDVALDPTSGDIFIAEWNNARIQHFTYTGATPVHRSTWGAVKATYR